MGLLILFIYVIVYEAHGPTLLTRRGKQTRVVGVVAPESQNTK